MENIEPVEHGSNGEEKKLEVNDVIAAEAKSSDEFNELIAKVSESVSESAITNLLEEDGNEDNFSVTDESNKLLQSEQNVEAAGEIKEDAQIHSANESVQESESGKTIEETGTEEEAHHELIMQHIEEHAEEAVELENYDAMSKHTLLERFKTLLEQEDAAGNKTKAFAIKDAFVKIATLERNEALAKFIEEGGIKEDFEKTSDTDEKLFNELFEKYKRKRAEKIEQVEKQKLVNFEEKQAVLNQLKNLIQHEENMQKAYAEFNELQNKWRSIGAVPAANVRDLLLNYKLYVDRFYDFVKINRELQALDQKKNLLLKVDLCDRAEQLMLEPSINKAIHQINNLMYEWREVGPIPREKKDELWQRFKGAVDKVFERKREHEASLKEQHDENLQKKNELIAKLEPFAHAIYEKHSQWQDALKEVMQISADYKKIGHASRKENEEAWTKFKALGDSFFKNKNEFYQARKKENAANIQLKTELCIQAEGLRESNDWKATSQELIRLQEEWKKVGHIFDKQNQKLWTRFKSACDEFFNRKNAHFSSVDKEYDENYNQKVSLVEQIENFSLGEDNQVNLDQIRDFQRQWTEIGLVPIKKKEEIQKRYRAAIDKLFNSLKMDEKEKASARFTQRNTGSISHAANTRGIKHGAGRSETGAIASKINALTSEVNTWQNNIGFFSKSKNADVIRREFEEKINKAQSEIAALKLKLKELKEA